MSTTASNPFHGLHVALPASQDLDGAARLMQQAGAHVLRFCGAVEEGGLRSLETWLLELTDGQYDDVVFCTAQSVRLLMELSRQLDKDEAVVRALKTTRKLAQGGKVAAALEQYGLSYEVVSPQPTMESLVGTVKNLDLAGRTVAVASPPTAALIDALESKGATVRVLSNAEPIDGQTLTVLDKLLARQLDVVLFGAASQVTRLWEAACVRGSGSELRTALSGAHVVALGSAAAIELRQNGMRVDSTPDRALFVRPSTKDLAAAMALNGSSGPALGASSSPSLPGATQRSHRKTVVLIGNGMVSHKLCEKLTEYDKSGKFELVTFCEEPRPAYDRVKLSSWFETRDADHLKLADLDWYKSRNIRLLLGERAVRLNRKQRAVLSSSGEWVRYDHAVLCTGSLPFVPPIPGVDKQGVFVYRTIEDLEQIAAYAGRAKRAAVLGGGLLGLEAAKALLDLGLETHVVEFAPRLMPRQLDPAGARLLERTIRSLGVQVHLNAATAQVLGNGVIEGLAFKDGQVLDADMLVISAGIRPRDELARECGLEVGERGGVVVDDQLRTSDPSVFAIGECALHRGTVYGLVAPCYEMADVVARTLTGESAKFEGADQSAKLKLLGVDVASFGDPFADGTRGNSVVFEDLVRGVYKKVVVSEDGKQLLGGVLVGDAADYARLASFAKGKVALSDPPEELVLGKRSGSGGGAAALSDELQVCSCNNVTKGAIAAAIRDGGCSTLNQVKTCTKAGTSCGGCMPLVTDILNAELKAAGKAVRPVLCEHFAFSRQELFQIVKVNRARSFEQLLASHGKGNGCEICKPVVASILASVFNDVILKHDTLQDTNDRFLANVQRTGLYSIVPRVPGGEITPDKLIKLGEVAKKYNLYTKLTGGQRIDLFGAQLNQLPEIWEELVNAGFESGHAYGKALRTVKSCVGSTWCRYGVRDSVGFAIRVENRYKGIRAPHKLKSAVSGCVRECAEAQSKDFGLIATEKGYNVYVCGNGGAKPRHADLLAAEVDEETAIRYLDRFIMYYIATADKLTRTSVWLEKLEGGIEHLRDVIIHDRLGICAELEKSMQYLVDTYTCEWAEVVNNPELRARFRHYANSSEPDHTVEFVSERGQRRPADWTKREPSNGKSKVHLPIVRANWVRVANAADFPKDGGMTIKYGNAQIAVFNFASRGEWYACQNMCPHTRDMVLARGIVGDQAGQPKVACPMHKKTFSLENGECLSGEAYKIRTFPVRVEDGGIYLELPSVEEVERLLEVGRKKSCDHDCATEARSTAA